MILAIDDDINRYDGLRLFLEKRSNSPELVVASCETCVLEKLQHASVILLDYDLDSFSYFDKSSSFGLCPCCKTTLPERSKGIQYVPEIAATKKPVLVVSASYPENIENMVKKLKAHGVENLRRHSAREIMPEYAWIATLWEWGII